MKRKEGFTLIELMIVVAIIAIIAAIAIPSILRSRMSANQTSAVGTLDSLLKMNAQFRSNDSERNGENDYWVENVFGLHGVQSAGGDEIELVPETVANSDFEGVNDDINTNASGFTVSTFASGDLAPKSGYYVSMQVGTGSGSPCNTTYAGDDVSTDSDYSALTNDNRYSVTAFPELYDNTGTKAYLLNESGTTFEIDAKDGSLSSKFNGSGGSTGDDGPNASEGTAPLPCEPTESDLDSNWSTSG